MAYWLMKTEPDTFSIDDLAKARYKTAPWEGVRNYQARNYMLEMKLGDQVLIYHSSCDLIGLAGVAKVVKKAYPDPTSLDKNSKYYDEKSTPDRPRWFMVDVQFQEKFPKIFELKKIKAQPLITEIQLIKKGSRLSVMPVIKAEFDLLVSLAREN